MTMSITAEQRANLEKLATYLEGLPVDYRHFTMDDWFAAPRSVAKRYALHNGGVASCGAVACAIGHAPAAGILVPEAFIVDDIYVNWDMFSRKVFGGDQRFQSWLFDCQWTHCDNTHRGAAARIRFAIAHGGPPTEWVGDVDEGKDGPSEWLGDYAPYLVTASGTEARSVETEGLDPKDDGPVGAESDETPNLSPSPSPSTQREG